MIGKWAPPQWDITVPAGADFRSCIEWIDSEDSPVDLAGYSAKMDFRRKYEDAEPLITLTDTDGITLGANGTICIDIPAARTTLLGAFKRVSVVTSMELTSSVGVVYRLFDGKWQITPEATR